MPVCTVDRKEDGKTSEGIYQPFSKCDLGTPAEQNCFKTSLVVATLILSLLGTAELSKGYIYDGIITVELMECMPVLAYILKLPQFIFK